MNLEPFAELLKYFVTNIKTKSTFIKDPKNVMIGESLGLVRKPDSFFPRAEILIKKDKSNGYLDQRNMDKAFRIDVGCHHRRPHNEYTEDDMFENIRFGEEIKRIMYGAHSDKIKGIKICEGFIQLGGFPEVFYEHETFPKISTAIVVCEAEVQLRDDFTNN